MSGSGSAGREPAALRALSLFTRMLDRALRLLLIAIVVAIIAVVGAQFVDRRIADLPIAAPDQYARIGLVWLCFVGFALAIRNGVNIRVDLVDARLPIAVRRWLAIAFDLVIAVLVVTILVQCRRVIEIGSDQLLLGTPLSAAVPPWGLFLSGVATLPFLAERVWRAWRGEVAPAHHGAD
jgi:TRAP-type C4-dicarboxylate transport system permease small subunit